MGRKSKLTPEVRQRCIERRIAGESYGSIAKSVGMSESALRGSISAEAESVKTVANQMVAADHAFNQLGVSAGISAQITAKTLAAKLMRTMDNMASGAELASGSYLRLMMAHNAQAQLVDESDPMGTRKGNENAGAALVAMAALGKLANQVAEVPVAFARVMKEGMSGQEDEEGGVTITVRGGLPD